MPIIPSTFGKKTQPQSEETEEQETGTAGPDRKTINTLLRLSNTSDARTSEQASRLLSRFSADLDPQEAERRAIPQEEDDSFLDDAKRAGGTLLGGIANVLGRAQGAVFGAIDPEEGQSRLQGAARGISGHDNRTLAQVLDKQAPGGFIAGTTFKLADFIGTALTDPTTYLSLGTTSAAKQGLNQVARAAGRETAEQVAKRGLRSLDDEALGLIGDLGKKSTKALEKGASRARIGGVNIAGKRGVGRKAQRRIVGEAKLSGFQKLNAATEALEAAEDSYRAMMKGQKVGQGSLFGTAEEATTNLLKAQQAVQAAQRGISDIGQLPATRIESMMDMKIGNMPIFAGKLTDAAGGVGKAFSEAFIPQGLLKDPASRAAFQAATAETLGRATAHVKTAAFHVQKVLANSKLSKADLKGLTRRVSSLADNGGIVTKDGLTDLAEDLAEEGLESQAGVIRALAERATDNVALKSTDDFREVFDQLISAPQRRTLKADLERNLAGKGVDITSPLMDAEIAAWKAVQDIGAGNRAMRFWRRAAIRTPGFHVRNEMTDWFNMMQEVIPKAKDVVDGMQVARALRALPEERVDRFGDEIANWTKEFENSGVLGSNVFHQVESSNLLPLRNKANIAGRFGDQIFRAGGVLADHTRATMYLSLRKGGFTEQAARERVFAALGNYAEYTKLEKQVLRNTILPFYKFQRFNVPFQVAKLASRPGVANAQIALMQAFNAAVPPIEGPVPLQVAQRGLIGGFMPGSDRVLGAETGFTAGVETMEPIIQAISTLPGIKRFAPDALKPEEGLGRAMRELAAMPSGPSWGGIIKGIAEIGTSQDFFSGAPIKEQEAWTRALLSFLPEVSRAIRFNKTSDKVGMALSSLAGISNLNLTDSRKRGEAYRRLDIAQKLLEDAETDDRSIASLSDLESAGLVRKPPTRERTEEEADEASRRRALSAQERQQEDLDSLIAQGLVPEGTKVQFEEEERDSSQRRTSAVDRRRQARARR